MAAKSIAAGYMPDAKAYLVAAHEADPADSSVVLKLGWVNNILHDDREAIDWFNQARKSSDPAIASEAGSAYENLRPEFALFRATSLVVSTLLHALARSIWLCANQNRSARGIAAAARLLFHPVDWRYPSNHRPHSTRRPAAIFVGEFDHLWNWRFDFRLARPQWMV